MCKHTHAHTRTVYVYVVYVHVHTTHTQERWSCASRTLTRARPRPVCTYTYARMYIDVSTCSRYSIIVQWFPWLDTLESIPWNWYPGINGTETRAYDEGWRAIDELSTELWPTLLHHLLVTSTCTRVITQLLWSVLAGQLCSILNISILYNFSSINVLLQIIVCLYNEIPQCRTCVAYYYSTNDLI